jgi:hypothetical protein
LETNPRIIKVGAGARADALRSWAVLLHPGHHEHGSRQGRKVEDGTTDKSFQLQETQIKGQSSVVPAQLLGLLLAIKGKPFAKTV